eukprot:TRINITY_DN124632_c0_g1_i1.p2 TRINITY_DN124632_c0_g1~~TRINITY_DN124632_c0_g1_i1.p2  ORF type:complete len:200 (-),score=11.94 TRINITY_DN124632_c0_g1_i1:441-1040(-)
MYEATEVSVDSLLARKQQILENAKNTDGILDKALGFQPRPTLDIMTFVLPTEFYGRICSGVITPLSLSEDLPKVGEYFALIRHQNHDLVIKQQPTSEQKYVETLKCFTGDIWLCDYVYPGKSLSCTCIKAADSLLLYTGTSSEGTSGGPLLNYRGEIVGISAGNYFEYQVEEPISEEKDVKYPIYAWPRNRKNCRAMIS